MYMNRDLYFIYFCLKCGEVVHFMHCKKGDVYAAGVAAEVYNYFFWFFVQNTVIKNVSKVWSFSKQ